MWLNLPLGWYLLPKLKHIFQELSKSTPTDLLYQISQGYNRHTYVSFLRILMNASSATSTTFRTYVPSRSITLSGRLSHRVSSTVEELSSTREATRYVISQPSNDRCTKTHARYPPLQILPFHQNTASIISRLRKHTLFFKRLRFLVTLLRFNEYPVTVGSVVMSLLN